jgi:hypothetical protein
MPHMLHLQDSRQERSRESKKTAFFILFCILQRASRDSLSQTPRIKCIFALLATKLYFCLSPKLNFISVPSMHAYVCLPKVHAQVWYICLETVKSSLVHYTGPAFSGITHQPQKAFRLVHDPWFGYDLHLRSELNRMEEMKTAWTKPGRVCYHVYFKSHRMPTVKILVLIRRR